MSTPTPVISPGLQATIDSLSTEDQAKMMNYLNALAEDQYMIDQCRPGCVKRIKYTLE